MKDKSMLVLGLLLIAVLMSGCSLLDGPGLEIIQQAIAQQVTLSQQQLSTQFYAQPHQIPFSIRRIRVNETDVATIKTQTAYHVTGVYDIRFSGASRTMQADNASNVYVVQSAETNKQWWLALPEPDSDAWAFYPLP